MTIVWIVLGVLCLLYFMILLAKHVHFCAIWFLIGILMCGLGIYLRIRERYPLPEWIEGVGVILGCVALVIFLLVESQIVFAMNMPDTQVDYLIVLGAQVKKTVPSKALRLRLDCALEWLEEQPEAMAILSGGQGDGEEITEAQCMKEYLIEHGISSERLVLEDKSETTMQNLQFSSKLVTDLKEKKVGLVTNNFHVYRSVKFARKLGYENVVGIPAKSDAKLQIHYLVREFFALLKEMIKR